MHFLKNSYLYCITTDHLEDDFSQVCVILKFSSKWYSNQQGQHSLFLYRCIQFSSVQFSSFTQACLTLCDPMNHSTPDLPVHHHLCLSSLRLTSIESVMPSSHLILCRPLLLLPPILPRIKDFSNESTLRMRWPKYWSFSFSIIPSKESQG